jgi:hypothetical protein
MGEFWAILTSMRSFSPTTSRASRPLLPLSAGELPGQG